MPTFGVSTPEFPSDGCALVFGATGGIGAATAGLLAERGCDVALTYRGHEDDAARVADWIRATGKNLTTVYITHGHGDHFFGADVIPFILY